MKDLAMRQIEKGDELKAQGDLTKALECYEKALTLDPWSLAAGRRRAHAFFSLGEYQGAAAACRETLHIYPRCADLWELSGKSLLKMNRFQASHEAWKKVAENTPGGAPGRKIRVIIKALESKEEKGNQWAKELADIDNPLVQILIELGDWHLANHRYSDAVARYGRALILDPGLPKIWCIYGSLKYAEEDYGTAEKSLRNAVKLDPGYSDAWWYLAKTLYMQGRRNEARSALRSQVRASLGTESEDLRLYWYAFLLEMKLRLEYKIEKE